MPALFCKVDGVSAGSKGISDIKTQKSLRRDPQQSVRFQMTIEVTVEETPRSTCHQGWASMFVWVTEPWKKFPSVTPSTAEAAPADPNPTKVLLWVEGLPRARFVVPTT